MVIHICFASDGKNRGEKNGNCIHFLLDKLMNRCIFINGRGKQELKEEYGFFVEISI